MSGHSKWSTIKRKKGANDAKRGKLFAKLVKAIEIAAKNGGTDPANNASLYQAISKAKSNSVPNDNIERALKRVEGNHDSGEIFELTYEGYGPGGGAILCETLTDNKNRTVAEVRHGFSKFGCSMGTSGSVAYLFERTGIISFPGNVSEEEIMDHALNAGAHDILGAENGGIDVMTSLENFGAVQDALKAAGIISVSAEMTMLASTEIDINLKDAEKLLDLIDHLEELDDVQNVFSNANISAEIIAKLQ